MSGIIGASPNMNSGVVGAYPIGHVLQVESYTNSTETATTSGTLVATPLTDSITMTSASNKVVIIANVAGALKTTANYIATYSIYRGSTNLAAGASTAVGDNDCMGNFTSGDANQSGTNVNMCYVDTPGAGTHSYTVYFGSANGSYNVYFSVWGQTSQIVLMEVVV